MNNFRSNHSRKSKLIVALAIAATGMFQTACSDLWSEQHPETYYINSGETIADWLLNRNEEYSDFIYCLDVANVWGEMRTYGGHTCFAPDNEAFKIHLNEVFGDNTHTVYDLTKGQCDTIAKTHLCNSTFFCNDLVPGQTFPYPNLLDRYLTYDIDSTLIDSARNSWKPVYKVNKMAELIVRDDTVQNGVVHKVNRIINPSNDFLPDVMLLDSNITYFYNALLATGLVDSLSTWYMDYEYIEPDYDSTLLKFQTEGTTAIKYSTSYEHETAILPNHRYFKFTAFVPTNDVFERKGLADFNALRDYARSIYGDANYTDDNGNTFNSYDSLQYAENSLKKFLLYHILPEELTYGNMNILFKEITNNYQGWEHQDVEDFYETMLPHSIIRISTPYEDKGYRFINRKGIIGEEGFIPGLKVIEPKVFTGANNGRYYYLDEFLLYDDHTRKEVLKTRMRYMCNTLSPDFINSNATGRYGGNGESSATADRYVVGFRQGKTKNFAVSDQTEFYVRYADSGFGCYMGYEMTIRGMYDVMVKLPPVPYEGTYEVRMFMNTMASAGSVGGRGVVQIYFREGGEEVDWEAQDIPLDLRIAGNNARIGNMKDSEITQNISGDEAKQLAIQANEKAMHNRGYMKAPASYGNGTILRDDVDCLRRILVTRFMRDTQDYWIRIRLVLDDPTAVCPFNFIEIVPKDVYAGNVPEDKY